MNSSDEFIEYAWKNFYNNRKLSSKQFLDEKGQIPLEKGYSFPKNRIYYGLYFGLQGRVRMLISNEIRSIVP
jgi:hypothetical protein